MVHNTSSEHRLYKKWCTNDTYIIITVCIHIVYIHTVCIHIVYIHTVCIHIIVEHIHNTRLCSPDRWNDAVSDPV